MSIRQIKELAYKYDNIITVIRVGLVTKRSIPRAVLVDQQANLAAASSGLLEHMVVTTNVHYRVILIFVGNR